MVVGLFHYGGPDYTDILQRAVVVIGGSLLDTRECQATQHQHKRKEAVFQIFLGVHNRFRLNP